MRISIHERRRMGEPAFAELMSTQVKEDFNPNIEIDENPFSEDIKQYDSWSLKELKEECISRGLSSTGTKATLAMRLKENDTPSTIGETEAPSEEAADVEPEAPSEEAATIGEISNEETNTDTEQEPTTEE